MVPTEEQKQALRLLHTFNNGILLGKAGTGKTFTAMRYAIGELVNRKIEKIYILRPPLGVYDYSLGYNKGTLEEKLVHWNQNIYDLTKEISSENKQFVFQNIELVPIEMIRGRTFRNSVVILDEAQNITYKLFKTIVTRIGTNSTLIITGDTDQSDLPHSDLEAFIEVAKKHPDCFIVELHDVVRSENCSLWLKAFEEVDQTDD